MRDLLERVGEIAGAEHARTEPEDVTPQVADHAVDLGDELLDAIREACIADKAGGALQSDAHRVERLDDTVMQVASDSLTVFDHPETRDFSDGARIFESEARLLRETLEQRNVGRREVRDGPLSGRPRGRPPHSSSTPAAQ